MDRALAGNLDSLRHYGLARIALERDPALEPIDVPAAPVHAARAILGMNLGVMDVD